LRGDARKRLAEVLARRETLAWALFLGVLVLSLVHAENRSRSLLILIFVAFTSTQVLVLPTWLRSARDFLRVRWAILTSATLVAAFGLWQFVGDMAGAPVWLTGLRPQYTKVILGFTRVQSTSLEPLYFADYLILPMALIVAWLLARGGRKAPKPLWILLALIFIDLALTSSRGGYAGAAAALLALAWFHRDRWASIKRLASILALSVVGIVVALGLVGSFITVTPGTTLGRFVAHVTTVTDGAAVVERLNTFSSGFAAFRSSPWLGIGIGGYGPFVATYARVEPDSGWPIVNNEPIELLAETGIVGLAFFLAFLVAVFVVTKNPPALRASSLFKGGEGGVDPDLKAIRLGTLAALIGMLVQYQTFSTLYVMHIWFTIGLLLAVSRYRLPKVVA
jgi:O-antigen ligase